MPDWKFGDVLVIDDDLDANFGRSFLYLASADGVSGSLAKPGTASILWPLWQGVGDQVPYVALNRVLLLDDAND